MPAPTLLAERPAEPRPPEPIRIEAPTVRAGYGTCSDCSCPAYAGSGYTCGRGGCSHHYDRHW